MPSSKRESDLARLRGERQQARLAAAATPRRPRRAMLAGIAAAVVVGVTTLAVLSLGNDSPATPATAVARLASAAPTSGPACVYTASGTASRPVKPPSTKEAEVERISAQPAVLTTSQGVVTLSLDSVKAPCTVNSFTSLAKQKYFDGTGCHRLTTRRIFFLQCGAPAATGLGGPGYTFGDENLTGATYPAGTLAMANSGAGTNGSQFFLVYQDSPLPANYTPFGTITGGLDVLAKVAAGGSVPTGDGKPTIAVTLTTVEIQPIW